MADTASLVARVKTEGVETANKQLDDFSASAAMAAGEAAAYERAQAKAASEAKKSTPIVKGLSDVTDVLGNKIAVLEEAQVNGARSAAILAAQLKLGAAASQEEIKHVGDLTGRLFDLTTAQNKTGTAAGYTTKSMGSLRNGAQQAGYQIQDLVVQMQGGTSAFVAIGQQGSQLAGAFGPGGAVLGAIIALASAAGGVLYKSLGNARASTEELKTAQDSLKKVLDQTSSGAYETSDALAQLVLSGASAAEQAALIASANQGLRTQMKDAALAVKEATDATSTWTYGNAVGAQHALELGESTSSLTGFLGNLADKFGLSAEEATKLTPLLAAVQKNASPDNIRALGAETANLAEKHGDQNAALVTLNGTLQNWITLSRNAENSQKALADAQANATKRINEQNEAAIANLQARNAGERAFTTFQAQEDKKRFANSVGVTEAQITAYNAARDKQEQQDIARLDNAEAKKQSAADKTTAAQQKRVENEAARQQKAAADFLAQIDRTNGDEIDRITATEQQKLEKLAEFRQQNLISEQEFEQARTGIQTTAETARQEALKKKREEEAQKQGKRDQFIADIEALNATELEMIDVQAVAKEAKAKEFRDRGIISEKEYQASIAEIAKNSDDKRLDVYSRGLSDMTSNLKTALGENNALYKAAAITQTIIDTYKGAQAAYASFATIPIIGPALGVAAAAAAVAAGLARVQSIRSAREQGGNLSPGQISTIAERGQPEVIMPAGASRVRTAQQMRQIMGENGGANRTPTIHIVNQTTGRVDSVTTEQLDETQIRVIIRETVSTDMNDSNSIISRALRGTRGQPGF